MTGAELFTIGSYAVTVGDIVTVAGAGLSAMSSISQGQAQANAAKYNAQVAENNAIAVRQQAAAQEERQRRAAAARQGAIRAGYGASGVSVEGSPLDVLEQSAANEELDALTTRYNGQVASNNYLASAALDRSRASYASTSGYMGAGTALLMGAGRVASGMYSRGPAGTSLPVGGYTGPRSMYGIEGIGQGY